MTNRLEDEARSDLGAVIDARGASRLGYGRRGNGAAPDSAKEAGRQRQQPHAHLQGQRVVHRNREQQAVDVQQAHQCSPRVHPRAREEERHCHGALIAPGSAIRHDDQGFWQQQIRQLQELSRS